MTASLTSVGRVGDARPTEHHWQAATDLLTRGGSECERVQAVARAIADAEQRGRDDVRFGSAYCPDCGAHCDTPHRPRCPWAATPLSLERHR